jgi:hypothetical protein
MVEVCAYGANDRNHKLLHSMNMNNSNISRELLNLLYIPVVIFVFILFIKMLNWLPFVILEVFLK